MEKRCAGSITVPEDGVSKDDMWLSVSLSQEVRRRNPSFCCQGMWACYWGTMVPHLTRGVMGRSNGFIGSTPEHPTMATLAECALPIKH